MIRLYDFDEVRPEEILNRDIRAEADVEPPSMRLLRTSAPAATPP